MSFDHYIVAAEIRLKINATMKNKTNKPGIGFLLREEPRRNWQKRSVDESREHRDTKELNAEPVLRVDIWHAIIKMIWRKKVFPEHCERICNFVKLPKKGNTTNYSIMLLTIANTILDSYWPNFASQTSWFLRK
jgi:hypothetical protein